ncbi:hypothetical protein NUSPORA_00452 [Nucleospora cyclopteri]
MQDLNFKRKRKNIQQRVVFLEENASVYKKKLEVYQSKLEIKRKNNAFELFRNKFYKNLTGGFTVNYSLQENEI